MSLTIKPAQIVEESDSPLLRAPSDWTRHPLKDVATIINGFAFKSKHFVAEGGVPLIRIRDLFHRQTTAGYVGHYDDRYVVQPGELLVGMDGDFNCALWSGAPALLNQRLCKLVPDPENLRLDYLSVILPAYLEAIHDVTSSTTVTHLSSRDVAEIPIPVPSLDEQQRLARMIGQVEGREISVGAHLQSVADKSARLRTAVVLAACTGRLTTDWRQAESVIESDPNLLEGSEGLPEIPDGWRWLALPGVGEMGRGKSKHRPRNDPTLYEGGEYPFIQTGDIARSKGRIRSHSQQYNEKGLEQSRLWPTGTVCITIAANIADSGILTYPACFPDSVVGIIVNPSVALADYIELFIRTARADLAAFAPATAQANINLAILSEVMVPIPPIEEQAEIVRRIEGVSRSLDDILTRTEAAKRRLSDCSKSVLVTALSEGSV